MLTCPLRQKTFNRSVEKCTKMYKLVKKIKPPLKAKKGIKQRKEKEKKKK